MIPWSASNNPPLFPFPISFLATVVVQEIQYIRLNPSWSLVPFQLLLLLLLLWPCAVCIHGDTHIPPLANYTYPLFPHLLINRLLFLLLLLAKDKPPFASTNSFFLPNKFFFLLLLPPGISRKYLMRSLRISLQATQPERRAKSSWSHSESKTTVRTSSVLRATAIIIPRHSYSPPTISSLCVLGTAAANGCSPILGETENECARLQTITRNYVYLVRLQPTKIRPGCPVQPTIISCPVLH